MFDAHIHLDQYPKEEIKYLIERWREAGIRGIIAVSTNLASSYKTLELSSRFPDFVHAAVGYHPEQKPPASREWNELVSLIQKEKERIVAIGEVGLPHYHLGELGESALEEYKEILGIFSSYAHTLDLPLLLHAVHDKALMACQILQEYQVKKAHFHWLKAKSEDVQVILDEGYFVSVTPEVTYRQRDQDLLRKIPLEQLLLETDGPWKYSGPYTMTTPLLLFDVVESVASIKQIPLDLIRNQLMKNASKLIQSSLEDK